MSKHEFLNAVEKSKAVSNMPNGGVSSNHVDRQSEEHGESWRKTMDETRADRLRSHNAKSDGRKSHAQLESMNSEQ